MGKRRETRAEWFDRYSQYLASPAWKAKRKEVLDRAGHRCRKCPNRATHVHHTKRAYASMRRWGMGKEPILYLVPLCGDCHDREHGRHVGWGGKPGLSS